MKNISEMLRQAQAMQSKMAEMQARLAETEVEGAAGGGMVQITLNGKGEMRRLKVDPSLLNPAEPSLLEDLVVAAHADAKRRADEHMQGEMQALTGGLNLPPGFKLPFG